tara:strand:+ start:976 stop:2262 length:1287 start_codon:yes stop_codon:yes gene_type:complete
MSDGLLALILPLTLLLTILLCVHGLVLRQFGAKAVYLSWLSVPLLLVFYTFVAKIFSVEQMREQSTHFESVLVFSTQAIQQASDAEYVMASSLVISALLMMISIVNHLSFKRQLLQQCDHFKPSNAQPDNKIIAEVITHRSLKVVISHQTQSPMLVGLIRPILVLPDDFAELYNTEQQQLILTHEICHFDRNDIYWNLLAFGILALYWFHPLAWLAYFRFRRDQELSCDQTTLARKPFESRMNYGRALLITAQQTPKLAIAHLSFNEYGDKAVMLERIKQIKSHGTLGKSAYVAGGLLAITLMTGASYAGHVGQQKLAGDKVQHTQADNKVYPVMRIEPKYPLQAAKDSIEGAVLLKFDINGNGNTKNIRVVTSMPEKVFDKVAIEALLQWTYNATGKTQKNNVVQLDFMMDASSEPIHLVEKVSVAH